MIFWVAGAFLWGMMTPYMARRFAKFMPTTLACAVVELLRIEKRGKNYRKTDLYKKLVWRSVMAGLINAMLTLGVWVFLAKPELATVYVWVLLLAAEIDIRMFVLPDILTIPLMIIGIAAAYAGFGVVTIDESVWGALAGYFLPAAVSLLVVWYRRDAFGGGDIKLLAAVGAWLGVEGLLYVIAVASVLGLVTAAVQKKRELAFGPMLAVAGIAMMFWIGIK